MTDDSKVREVASLVTYQPGSVVSKVLMKVPNGSVTLFAFSAGSELSEHTAPFEAMVHVVDGRAEIGVAGEAHDVNAGEMIHLPANVPHWVKAASDFKMILTMIRSAT
jgi:quercetin dioxygenase-like cupin family protein